MKQKIHFTSETLADAAEASEWQKWRNIAKPLHSYFLDFTPILGPGKALGEWLGDLVDPIVTDAKVRRQRNYEYWASE